MKVFIRHARAVCPGGYCSRGMRQFAKTHGLDWEDFLHNGIDAEVLRAIDDDMARAVVLEAEKDGQG